MKRKLSIAAMALCAAFAFAQEPTPTPVPTPTPAEKQAVAIKIMLASQTTDFHKAFVAAVTADATLTTTQKATVLGEYINEVCAPMGNLARGGSVNSVNPANLSANCKRNMVTAAKAMSPILTTAIDAERDAKLAEVAAIDAALNAAP